jgi:uncharacterized damage-inducible protein DinB
MKSTDQLLAQLADEAPRTRRTLEHVPSGHDDWKPHEKSMAFGNLARLVATMPTWFPMIVNMEELDIAGGAGSGYRQARMQTAAEMVAAHDKAIADARAALSQTSDDHLMKPWKLLVAGKVVSEQPRSIVLRDTFMHWAHHRGQLTVYLRLLGAPVAAIYGPSADDQRFA